MKRALGTVAATVLALTASLGPAGPAGAAEVTVTDPQGDSQPTTLDLLGFTARNLDKRVAVEMTFEDTTRDGTIVVSVDPRSGDGVRMISKFRPAGHSHTYLLAKAFGEGGAGKNKKLRCRGLKLSQGMFDAGPTVTLSAPSRCVAGGDYGALRFSVLIEAAHDADWAPQQPDGDIAKTDWVARG